MKVDDINKTIQKKSKVSNEEMNEDEYENSRLKYIIMMLACLLMFENNYSFDNPQALQKQLTKDLDISITNYNLLYSAFSFPNIFLTSIRGLIIDFLGVRFLELIYLVQQQQQQVEHLFLESYLHSHYISLIKKDL
ncbi:unnamed protein product [Paramecium sonneborni]|uniref:Uncharacterized protein n=1 Tax=Paramecium sonneborni TaxID=65129 RepID=A0A8S1P8W3_9CILI|nr:unnamed protein product [Paramecium sonneborni]